MAQDKGSILKIFDDILGQPDQVLLWLNHRHKQHKDIAVPIDPVTGHVNLKL